MTRPDSNLRKYVLASLDFPSIAAKTNALALPSEYLQNLSKMTKQSPFIISHVYYSSTYGPTKNEGPIVLGAVQTQK